MHPRAVLLRLMLAEDPSLLLLSTFFVGEECVCVCLVGCFGSSKFSVGDGWAQFLFKFQTHLKFKFPHPRARPFPPELGAAAQNPVLHLTHGTCTTIWLHHQSESNNHTETEAPMWRGGLPGAFHIRLLLLWPPWLILCWINDQLQRQWQEMYFRRLWIEQRHWRFLLLSLHVYWDRISWVGALSIIAWMLRKPFNNQPPAGSTRIKSPASSWRCHQQWETASHES
jgi:hypothetical protein